MWDTGYQWLPPVLGCWCFMHHVSVHFKSGKSTSTRRNNLNFTKLVRAQKPFRWDARMLQFVSAVQMTLYSGLLRPGWMWTFMDALVRKSQHQSQVFKERPKFSCPNWIFDSTTSSRVLMFIRCISEAAPSSGKMRNLQLSVSDTAFWHIYTNISTNISGNLQIHS